MTRLSKPEEVEDAVHTICVTLGSDALMSGKYTNPFDIGQEGLWLLILSFLETDKTLDNTYETLHYVGHNLGFEVINYKEDYQPNSHKQALLILFDFLNKNTFIWLPYWQFISETKTSDEFIKKSLQYGWTIEEMVDLLAMMYFPGTLVNLSVLSTFTSNIVVTILIFLCYKHSIITNFEILRK